METPTPPPRSAVVALHRFLSAHSFYPLVLCGALASGFLVVRRIELGRLGYTFLVGNLLLAWTPYLLSLLATYLHQARSSRRWLVAAVWAAWLAMLPNAPYILTDLIHWRSRYEMPWWFDLGVVLMFGLAGCFAGIVSLRLMHQIVRRRAGSVAGWAFASVAAILSGFGIYLGRFERWNSWDLLTRPHALFAQTWHHSFNPYLYDRTLGVTLMFGAMILVTYVLFVTTSADRA